MGLGEIWAAERRRESLMLFVSLMGDNRDPGDAQELGVMRLVTFVI